jgi:phosphatidylserine/phosphatidylglycerophosphate/cardiolipin synthase-like enzyme
MKWFHNLPTATNKLRRLNYPVRRRRALLSRLLITPLPPLPSMMRIPYDKAHVRILVKETPFDGIENKIAITELQKELALRGLSDFVEIRFFSGDLIHIKAALIDKEWLVVGSQNFHYSAWGDQTLTEYNLVTDDPKATAEFERAYNYLWDDAVPVE